jgi:REP element-mobilizing transposase RayT
MRAIRTPAPGCFHVITRATGGGAFFRDDDDLVLFVHLLHSTAGRLGWTGHAYCLMTTHYHLVVETRQPNLSLGMQRINSVYVRSFNSRWGRFGSLVAERFHSRLIEDEAYLSEVCRYVFLNPVKAELCAHAADWPWSGGSMFVHAARL